jgi:hypothetical protein
MKITIANFMMVSSAWRGLSISLNLFYVVQFEPSSLIVPVRGVEREMKELTT